MILSCFCLYR